MSFMATMLAGAAGWLGMELIKHVRHEAIGIEQKTLPKPDDDPYRTAATLDGSIQLAPKSVEKTWRVREYHALLAVKCDRCTKLVSRDTWMGQLCEGTMTSSWRYGTRTARCPQTKPHFHWECDCGYEWLMASPDSPNEETCT